MRNYLWGNGASIVLLLFTGLMLSCSEDGDGLRANDDLKEYIPMASSDLASALADPVRPYVYVSDQAQNSVHFLNTDTYKIELSIAVGSDPTAMDMKADGSLLFVALSGGSQVAVIDLVTQNLLSNVDVPGTPKYIVLGANDLLYVYTDGVNPISIFDVTTLPAAAAGMLDNGGNNFIGGRSYDRTRLYTYSNARTLTQWDISGLPPVEIQADIIGNGAVVVTSSPDDTIFTTSTNLDISSTFSDENGDVSFYRTSDFLKTGTVNVGWNHVAVGISPAGDRVLVAHNDGLLNPIGSPSQRHDRNSKDLHIFDLLTYVQIGRYSLRDYVKHNGITYGPDGRIYLLLGTGAGNTPVGPGRIVTAKAIGVIIP